MKFDSGETITLGNYRYTIQRKLGQGAISDAYLAVALLDNDAPQVVIKTPVSDDPDIINQVRREIEVLSILNRAEMPHWPQQGSLPERLKLVGETAVSRLIIANLDTGQLDSGQPYIIQELAPPEFERFDIHDRADEIRMLTIIHAMSRAMALTHQKGFALQDFEPQTKGDRIRVSWLDDAQSELELKFTDWNITGVDKDIPQDMFMFGGHVYYLLLGRHLTLGDDKRPPINLSLGIENEWSKLTEGSRQIVQRLLNRDPKKRYITASELEADLSWWLETMRKSVLSDAHNRLNERLTNAQMSGDQKRVLAIADLALHSPMPEASRGIFEFYRDKAQEKIKNELLFPISAAISELARGGTGGFTQAINGFQRALSQHDPQTEVAKLARIYLYLAQSGLLLTEQIKDFSSSAVWRDLNSANAALRDGRWVEAETALIQAITRDPLVSCPPVNNMLALATAGIKATEALRILEQYRPRLGSAERDDWATLEEEQLTQVAAAVNLLDEAYKKAADEPEFAELYQREAKLLDQRRRFLLKYKEGDEYIKTAEARQAEAKQAEDSELWSDAAMAYVQVAKSLEAAIQLWEEILRENANQPRATVLYDKYRQRLAFANNKRIETQNKSDVLQQAREALESAQRLMGEHRYDKALPEARRATSLLPDSDEARVLLEQAELSWRLVQAAQRQLETAKQNQDSDRLEAALELVTDAISWDRQSFADLVMKQLPGVTISPALQQRLFILPPQLKEDLGATLQTLKNEVAKQQQEEKRQTELWQQLLVYRKDEQVSSIIEALNSEEERRSLSPDEQELRSWAIKIQNDWTKVDAVLKPDAPTQQDVPEQQDAPEQQDIFKNLREMASLIDAKSGPKSATRHKQLGQAWLAQSKKEPLTSVATLAMVVSTLSEGLRLFNDGDIRATQDNAQELLKVVEDLLGVGQEWKDEPPIWMSNYGEEFEARLLRNGGQATGLLRFTKMSGWPNLSDLAQAWHRQLLGYLVVLLQPTLLEARRLSQEKKFPDARTEAQRIWQYIPDELRSLLPPDIGEEGLAQLLPALGKRIEADTRFASILTRLNRRENPLTFAEAIIEVQEVDRRGYDNDVPTQELQTRVDDWSQAAKWEALLTQSNIPDEGYAQAIYATRQAVSEIDSQEKLSELSRAELDVKLRELRGKLRERVSRLYQELKSKLVATSNALISKPESDPKPFLVLYGQARWVQLKYQIADDPQPPDRIGDNLIKKLYSLAVEKFAQPVEMGEWSKRRQLDMADTEAILKTITTLHSGIKNPSPPTGLPVDKSLTINLSVSQLQLESFVEAVAKFNGWANYDNETGLRKSEAGQPPATVKTEEPSLVGGDRRSLKFRSGTINQVQTLALAIQESLKLLPAEVGVPGLAEELTRLKECAAELLNADKLYRQKEPQPMEGLSRHLLSIEKRYNEVDERWAWLLGPEQQAIQRGYLNLYDDLVNGLEAQVRGYFANDQKAVSSLTDFIEKATNSGLSIVQAAYQAISQVLGIGEEEESDAGAKDSQTKQDRRTVAEADKATIRRYCKYVMGATALWTAETPPINTTDKIKETWQSLYRLAQDLDKKLSGLSKNWIIGLFAIIIVVFLGAASIVMWNRSDATRSIEAAQATAAVVRATDVAQQTRDAGSLSATATADAQGLQTRLAVQNATATSEAAIMQTRNAEQAGGLSIQATQTSQANVAVAATLVAQATADAIALQATQSAQATADALANQCRDITLYNFEISAQPILQPIPVPTYVIGDQPAPQISATWVITNTGECPMNNIRLLIGDRTFKPVLNRAGDNATVQNLEPGETARLVISFNDGFASNPTSFGGQINRRWTVVVDNPGTGAQFELALRQHPELVLTRNGWIDAVTPTPTPTFTPIPPTPTFTPIPPTTVPQCGPQPTDPCGGSWACENGQWVCKR